MGGKSRSSSSSQSGSGQVWAQPYAKAGASSVQNVFNQAQPGLQQLTSLTQNSIIPGLQDKFQGSLQGANQASDYWKKLMGGGANNPYLQNVLSANNALIMDQINGQFAASGRYGSGAWAGNAARELANADNQLLYQDYYNQMQRQDAAAQALQSGNASDAGQLLSAIGVGAELPYTGTNNLANSLGAVFSGGNEKSKSTQKQGIGGILASAAAAGASVACDERLKENVRLEYVAPDGLNFYSFDYKPEFGLVEGRQGPLPMAQDVATKRPWAMGPTVDGYLTIIPALL